MPEKKTGHTRRETLVEKLVRRSLESVGGGVDSVFGRGRKPDALPATSDLSERLRRMIERQAQINQDGRKLAPHLIQIKYAWGQTSDEFQVALKRLKNELLIVAIDFINDNRFATLAPVKIESKADILTVGFTMSIGFDENTLRDAETVEIPIEIYAKLLPDYRADLPPAPPEIAVTVTALFPSGGRRNLTLHFVPEQKTTLTVGRIKETDLYLDDESVSKHHASLLMTPDGALRVADIGSTNGTFLNGVRIAYGKAYEVAPDAVIGFGEVKAQFAWEIPSAPVPETNESETLPDLSDTAKTPVAEENGIQIGVRSSQNQTDNEDEPATVVGAEDRAETDAFEEEPETINKNLTADEPETVNKQIISEPFQTPNVGGETFQTLSAEQPQTNSLPQFKPSAGQLSETRELSDFTQSLATNPLDQDSFDDDLQGFESLLAHSPDRRREKEEERSEAATAAEETAAEERPPQKR